MQRQRRRRRRRQARRPAHTNYPRHGSTKRPPGGHYTGALKRQLKRVLDWHDYYDYDYDAVGKRD